MTQNFLADLKTTLENCIAELDELHFMFCQNPEADFTGNRKLSFHDYIQFMVQMVGLIPGVFAIYILFDLMGSLLFNKS